MVTPDGRVKVLDFGLAKLREDAVPATMGESAPTRALTGDGRILGTVAYMSPEQAEGKHVDHRSDLFSLGVMVYEMATGSGRSQARRMSRCSPRSSKTRRKQSRVLNPSMPAALARIIKRALAKDADRRYQSAKDLRNDLELLREEHASGELTVPAMSHRDPPAVRLRLVRSPWAGRECRGGVHGGDRRAGSDRNRLHRSQSRPVFASLRRFPGKEIFPSLSPDGQWVVYSSAADGDEDIYLQSVSGQKPINLTVDSPDADREPAFSPDGERIAFRSDRNGGGIFVMGRTGESVRRIDDEGYLPAWSPDGRQLAYSTGDVELWAGAFSSTGEVWTVDLQSSRKRLLVRQGSQPTWSPDGKRIAYRSSPRRELVGVWTVSVSDGNPVRATLADESAWSPCWSDDGWLYYAGNRGGSFNIWRVRVQMATGAVTERAQAVTAPALAVGHLSVSVDGRRVAYAAIDAHANVQRVSIDPATLRVEGKAMLVTTGSRDWGRMAVAPDGQMLALESGDGNLFLSRADGTGLRELLGGGNADSPQWSQDGKRIFFRSARSGSGQVWRIDADGSHLAQVTSEPAGLSVPFVSPDGRRLVAHDHFKNPTDIKVFDIDGQLLESLPPSPLRFESTQWSPDATQLAIGEALGGLLLYRFDSRQYERLLNRGAQPVWASVDSIVFVDGQELSSINLRTKAIQRILTTAPEVPASPTFSPDHRWLYYHSGLEEADIWMATLN